jgi:hypothetical protein
MNTKPDEIALARWLEDDLQGAELAAFEESIHQDRDLYAQRALVRALRQDMAAVMPAVEEPAYPEFFNSRIEKSIRGLSERPAAERRWFWRGWWMPAAAAAGMAMTFWLGMQAGGRQELVATPPPPVEPLTVVEPGLYTPERGVDAEWFASEEAAATVIVLEGVAAIPDSMDFSETVAVPDGSESTADFSTPQSGGLRQ